MDVLNIFLKFCNIFEFFLLIASLIQNVFFIRTISKIASFPKPLKFLCLNLSILIFVIIFSRIYFFKNSLIPGRDLIKFFTIFHKTALICICYNFILILVERGLVRVSRNFDNFYHYPVNILALIPVN